MHLLVSEFRACVALGLPLGLETPVVTPNGVIFLFFSRACVVLQGHYSAVTSLCLAPDGWSLISGGRDKVVHVWDLRKNTKLVTVPVYEALEGEI